MFGLAAHVHAACTYTHKYATGKYQLRKNVGEYKCTHTHVCILEKEK